jgi:protein-disulfide isomerase
LSNRQRAVIPATRFQRLRKCAFAAIAFGALVLSGLTSASVASAQAAPATAPKAAPAKPAKPATSTSAKAPQISAPVKSYGSSSAPIKMEVFTDYECPSCRALFENTLRAMIPDYVASGKVYLVHHDFPLTMHKYGGEAARWANAAAHFGQFDAVEAALYDNQTAWAADGNIAKYVSAAMPAADFKRVSDMVMSCGYPAITSKPDGSNPLTQVPHPCGLDVSIEQDIELGYKIPVQATPTYVITYKGQRLPAGSGSVSWPILKQFFDSLMSQ